MFLYINMETCKSWFPSAVLLINGYCQLLRPSFELNISLRTFTYIVGACRHRDFWKTLAKGRTFTHTKTHTRARTHARTHTHKKVRQQGTCTFQKIRACTNPLSAAISEPLIPTFNCRHNRISFPHYVTLRDCVVNPTPYIAARTSPLSGVGRNNTSL
jgi:hypothetical protein